MNTDVRFFAYAYDNEHGLDIVEISVSEFESMNEPITYERHTVFENGCRQVCLTRDNIDNPIET